MDFASREQCWAELDSIGEYRVRELLAAGEYEGHNQAFVEEWLRNEASKRATPTMPTWQEPKPMLVVPPKYDFSVIVTVAAIVLVIVLAVVVAWDGTMLPPPPPPTR